MTQHVKQVYMCGPNVFCQVEFSWWRGYWGINIVVYSPERREYWQDTLGL